MPNLSGNVRLGNTANGPRIFESSADPVNGADSEAVGSILVSRSSGQIFRKEANGWMQMSAVTPLGTTIPVVPGSNRAAAVNTAITAAAILATDVQKVTIQLYAGTYYSGAARVTRPSGANNIRIVMDRQTVWVDELGGSVDDATNAMFLIDATMELSKMNTTLTVDVQAGALSITVANAGTIATGDRLVIIGRNSGGQSYVGDIGNSDGTNVFLKEVAEVASVAGNVITLAQPLAQNHATPGARPTVQAINAPRGWEIHGGRLRGSQGGITTATGVTARYAADTQIHDVAVEGATRTMILGIGALELDVRRPYSLGSNNGWVHFESCIRSTAREGRGKRGVPRQNSLGYPRPQVLLYFRCTDCDIVDFECVNGGVAGGMFYAGGLNNRFARIRCADMRFTAADYTRWIGGPEWGGMTGAFTALGFGSGHGHLDYAEFAFGTHVDGLVIDMSTMAGPTGVGGGVDWDAFPPIVCGLYYHDTLRSVYSNVSIINQGAVNNRLTAARWSDCSGVMTNYLVRGVSNGIKTENVQIDVLLKNYRYDPVAGSGTSNGGAFYFNHSANSSNGITIDRLQSNSDFVGFMRTGSGFTGPGYESRFFIRDLENDNGQWSHVVMAYNATGVNFASGEVVEIDPSYAGFELRVRTPVITDPTYINRLAIVVGGAPSDTGGGWIMVAKAGDASRLTVRCSDGAVLKGDDLIYDETAHAAGYQRRAKSAGATTPTRKIGTALTTKASGSAGSFANILTL